MSNKPINKSKEITQRKIIVTIITIVIGLVFSISIISKSLSTYKDNLTNNMNAGLNTAIFAYDDMASKDELYRIENEDTVSSLAGYAVYYFEKHGFNTYNLDKVIADTGNGTYVSIFKGSIDEENHVLKGRLIEDPRIEPELLQGEEVKSVNILDDDQLYTLLQEGYYTVEGVEYIAKPVANKGYVIYSWILLDIFQNQSMMSTFCAGRDEDMMRVNIHTGIIEDSSEEDVVGLDCSTIVDYDSISQLPAGELHSVKLSGGEKVYLIVNWSVKGQLFVAYLDKYTANAMSLRSVILPIVLSWIFMLMILIYVLQLVKYRNISKISFIHVIGKRYVDGKLINHVKGMSFFAVVLIVISMIYVQAIINFGFQNVNAKNDLHSLDFMIKLSDSNREIINEDFDINQQEIANLVAVYFMHYPEEMSGNTLYDMIKKMDRIYEISVYNDAGVCEHSVSYGVDGFDIDEQEGYVISNDEEQPEAICWDIINGKKDFVHYEGQNNSYYEVRRRLDADGIIRVMTSSKVLEEYENASSISSVVQSSYFGASTRMFIDKNDSTTLYVYAPGKDMPTQQKNVLSDRMLESDYSGITIFNGSEYYMVTKVSDDMDLVLISAVDVIELGGFHSLFIIINIVFMFFLQVLAFMLVMSWKFDEAPPKAIKPNRNILVPETLDEQMMDYRFRKVVRNMFVTTCIMIVVLLGSDFAFGKTSLLSYLFGNEWDKGLNLFSLTIILVTIAGAIIGFGIVQSLILFFTKNMGPRGTTIGRMLSSLLRFAMLIAVIIAVLYHLGLDMSTLIAGAGIVGALISFCAQQTVNDFLSGFFIVFEGLFNIGDWITVNGFRGQVIEIGIRTTRIAIGGNVQIINNSELKTITLMAPNGTGAICKVDIAYKEDVDEVIELIKNNVHKYTEAIPAIVEGPYVDGVVDLGHSGVTLYLWALADQERVSAVERDMRRVTKDLFDEHGIEIPFNQVTIHTVQ